MSSVLPFILPPMSVWVVSFFFFLQRFILMSTSKKWMQCKGPHGQGVHPMVHQRAFYFKGQTLISIFMCCPPAEAFLHIPTLVFFFLTNIICVSFFFCNSDFSLSFVVQRGGWGMGGWVRFKILWWTSVLPHTFTRECRCVPTVNTSAE